MLNLTLQTGGVSNKILRRDNWGGGGRNLKSSIKLLQSNGKKKQAIIKHNVKIYTEARYSALKSGRELYQQKRKSKGALVKTLFSLKLVNERS